MKKELLEKYANLIIKTGINIQNKQPLIINAPVSCQEFVRILTSKAYQNGAAYVMVNWTDEEIQRLYYEYTDIDDVSYIPNFIVDKYHEIVDKNYAMISLASPVPGVLKDIDPLKIATASKASNEKMSFFDEHIMASKTQWCVVGVPNVVWAKKVFPALNDNDAVEKLWEAILDASRIEEGIDEIKEWDIHMNKLARHNELLNQYDFKTLHFKNNLGTDLEIGLVDGHIWAGGGEYTKSGIFFAPNIPTEETFTMPHKDLVNGTVVATKPLNFGGKLIENFSLTFKDGKVISFSAEKEEETLKTLLGSDEGSKRLGEVALISHSSPISEMNILFLNTLFDENASCHLALGNAYPTNIKDGVNMSLEDLKAKGYNSSMNHVDFMFGSECMTVTGITKDGKRVKVFENGNFVF